MKARDGVWTGLVCALLGAAGTWLAGCEPAERNMTISVTPPTSSIVSSGATVFLTAQHAASPAGAPQTNRLYVLHLPLAWTVQDNGLGRILSWAGHSAVYEGNGRTGEQAIVVRDQIGNRGLALVQQR